MESKKIILLEGDGIGGEIVREAVKCLQVLNEFSSKSGFKLDFENREIGGVAIDSTGTGEVM